MTRGQYIGLLVALSVATIANAGLTYAIVYRRASETDGVVRNFAGGSR
jgi:hypothetical protein